MSMLGDIMAFGRGFLRCELSSERASDVDGYCLLCFARWRAEVELIENFLCGILRSDGGDDFMILIVPAAAVVSG